jgi:hypothetical protein
VTTANGQKDRTMKGHDHKINNSEILKNSFRDIPAVAGKKARQCKNNCRPVDGGSLARDPGRLDENK